MYLNSINIYRGIAIILIVSAHCYSLSEINIDTPIEKVFINLTAGSTFHFIFISGFLFYHIFYLKQKTNTFFFSKVRRLLVPYTFLSILPIIIKIKSEPEYWNAFLLPNGNSIINEYIIPCLLYYITGAHLVAYWYVPFAICLFLLYPLHIRFIEIKPRFQLIVLGIFYLAALLIHRPINNLAIIQSIVYFTPIYLLGILCSKYKTLIYKQLKGKELFLLTAVIALAILQVILGKHNSYQKLPFIYGGIDLILLQKSFLCVFFMIFLFRFEHSRNKLIALLASTSFGIYFIHGYVLRALSELKTEFGFIISYNWLFYFIIWILIILISMLLVVVLKKLSPKYSAYITGY